MLCLLSPEDRVPANHPLREVKRLAEAALDEMSPLFQEMYSAMGRPSIPPEQLLKAQLLIALYTIRSERLFCEQLDYNMLFRWFLNMSMVESSFDHSTFSFNRKRLIEHDVAKQFFGRIVAQARAAHLLSAEHFTVDGILIDAWASMKSFKAKSARTDDPPDDPGNPTVNFRGEKRRNDTHESTTDPEAKLARKGDGQPSRLSFSQHALIENRHGLLVDIRVAEANGFAERQVALEMLASETDRWRVRTVGADKAYDRRNFVEGCRALGVTPHVAQNLRVNGGSAVDGRTTVWPGYTISQRIRKRVEEVFGWTKTIGNFRKTRYLGRLRTEMASYFVGAAYNLLRIAKLLTAPA